MRIYTNAYIDRNLGDDLMIRLMAKSMPEHDFYLFVDRRCNFIPFMDLKNIHRTEIAFDKHFPYKDFDAIVTVGGSIFILTRRKYAFERMRYVMPLLRKARSLGLKTATIGCNLGPFRDSWCKKIAARQLALNGLVTVRDQKSYETLCDYKTPASLFPDMLFSMDVPYVPCNSSSSVLGISAYRNINSGALCMPYYESMAEIADSYIRRTQGSVRIFAFDCEGENDICAAYTIRRLMEHKKRCEVIVYDGDADEFIQKFEGCQSLIATRFHSMVLAQLSGVPVLPVVYSNKMTDALDDLSYSGKRLIYGEAIENVEEVVDCLTEKEMLFSLSREELNRLAVEAGGHMQTLKTYLSL